MVFSLDIGGTFTKFALIENNSIISKGSWKTVFNIQKLLENIAEKIPSKLDYIGISSGGFWKNSQAISHETIPATADGKFIDTLKKLYNCDVFIDNDARCAILCESEIGVLQKVDNAVMFLLGSSLGCAAKINGKIFTGNTGQATAMFAMPEIVTSSEYIYDESASSLEQIQRYKVTKGYENCDMLFIEQAALCGDIVAKSIIDNYAKTIAMKCWYAYLMYDPQCIAFGGGISNSKLIMNLIEEFSKGYFFMDKSHRELKIVKAQFGNDSNLLGAALLKKQSQISCKNL